DPAPKGQDLFTVERERMLAGHDQMVSDSRPAASSGQRYPRRVPDDWESALERTTDDGRAAADAIRALIRRVDPQVVEVVWPHQGTVGWGVGPKKMSEHYAYLAVHATHVNLGFYRGASLPDPAGLLTGTGKAMRHIPINRPADVERPEIAELLKAAKAEREAALAAR
ncbi:MAG TPA: DUF1801 domain-containing protein, partial [Candidatus Limnocylindria bacterium]|nr:DUF1801 domain-containing protein [Candidatus Limnocylindria bacterium]